MFKQLSIVAGIIVALIILGLYSFRIYTKSFSPQDQVNFSHNSGLQIKVEYSRPYKKGRKLFGYEDSLVPFGEVWRTGANEATEVTLNQDIIVAGNKLSAGTYTLFTIPGDISWTIIFNNELDQWGHFTYDSAKDALRVQAPSLIVPSDTERFTIEFASGSENLEMRLLWGQTMVTIPIVTV